MEDIQIKKKYERKRGRFGWGGFFVSEIAECLYSAVIRQVREVLLAGESDRDTEVLIKAPGPRWSDSREVAALFGLDGLTPPLIFNISSWITRLNICVNTWQNLKQGKVVWVHQTAWERKFNRNSQPQFWNKWVFLQL